MNLWPLITRLGEAQILLPAAGLALLLLAQRQDSRAAALRWAMALGLGTLVTTVSKVAFLGWGLGIAALDFTGFSGHSMYAASVDIPLLAVCTLALVGRGRWVGALLGTGLAVLIAVSRVEVGAHSVSEAIAGFVLGGALAAWMVAALPARWPAQSALRTAVGLAPLGLTLWLAAGVAWAPPPVTHALVIRLSLALSGHERPYTRAHLHAVPKTHIPARTWPPAGETDLA